MCKRFRMQWVPQVSSSGTVPCSQTVWMPGISYSSQTSPVGVTCSFLTMLTSLPFWHLFLHFYLPSDHSNSGFATHHLEQSWHLLLKNKDCILSIFILIVLMPCIGGGHGNPLQNSCLENPKDRGAWRATVHWVAKRRSRLKWLSTRALRQWLLDFILHRDHLS